MEGARNASEGIKRDTSHRQRERRVRQSDKVTSCPHMVNRVHTVRPFPWRLKTQTWWKCNSAQSLPPLSAPLACHIPPPFLSIFTLYSLYMCLPSFHPHQTHEKLSVRVRDGCSSSHPRFPVTLLFEEMWPRGLHEWSHFCYANNTMYTKEQKQLLKESTYKCVCVCLHNGVKNWLFSSNNNISQRFSTPMWLITMPTLAWHPYSFPWLAENHMRHD